MLNSRVRHGVGPKRKGKDMNKQTLKQIREEATQWARRQAAKEAANPELKKLMDELREAEAIFFASQH